MKTLAIYFSLILWAGIINAQEIIELPETRVGVNTLTSNYYTGNTYSYYIKDSLKGEFERNPLDFIKKHFDIQTFMEEVANSYDSYEVNFKTRKGILRVNFDDEGNITKTYQKFKDIVLPIEMYHQIYQDHKGWAMTGNMHFVKGKGDRIEKEVYRIKLEKGNKSKTVKLLPGSFTGSEVVFD